MEDAEIISVTDTYTDFEKEILDGLQLAFKVTANSLVKLVLKQVIFTIKKSLHQLQLQVVKDLLSLKSMLKMKRIIHMNLRTAKQFILKNKVVYGDTDSVFVHFQTLDELATHSRKRRKKKSIELAIYTEKQIQKHKTKASTSVKNMRKHLIHSSYRKKR